MVLLIGCNGNMGRRYASVLRHLGIDWIGVDVGDAVNISPDIKNAIVATPTDTHINTINKLPTSTSILCEKPVSKNIDEVISITNKYSSLYMVNNWWHVVGLRRNIPIRYNYYNTGKDGFWWDLIQPLYISNASKSSFECTSPVFDCRTDDIVCLNQKHFDESYIKMIKSFISNETNKLWGKDDIIAATRKVLSYVDSNSSKK